MPCVAIFGLVEAKCLKIWASRSMNKKRRDMLTVTFRLLNDRTNRLFDIKRPYFQEGLFAQ